MTVGIVSAALVLAAPFIVRAQSVVVPRSSEVRAEDAGVRSRTHFYILPKSQSASPSGETPQSIRSVYNLPSTGGSGIIAIVDAFHYPTAEADLNVFSSQFGLPPCTIANGCFTQAFAYGTQPPVDCGWNQEAALDLQWAHAMAPNAKIVLVEAASNRNIDLYLAVLGASLYIAQHGGVGEVSMSWGGAEFAQEVNLDFLFSTPGIVYFASSGDTGSLTEYPSASPNVVAAGGTSIKRSSNGTFLAETAWTGSGGGISKYEPRPAYQSGVAQIVGAKRGIPDISFDSDPATGVSVYTGFKLPGRERMAGLWRNQCGVALPSGHREQRRSFRRQLGARAFHHLQQPGQHDGLPGYHAGLLLQLFRRDPFRHARLRLGDWCRQSARLAGEVGNANPFLPLTPSRD